MGEQHRFEIDLVDPVRRLRRRPPGIRAVLGREALGAARNFDARDFASEKRGAIDHVVGIIRRQSGVAHLLRDAEPAEDFHRTCRDVVRLDAGRLARRAGFQHDDVDAAPGQIHGQGQPDRTCANHHDIGMKPLGHFPVSARNCLLGHLDIAGAGNRSPAFEIRRDDARKLFR